MKKSNIFLLLFTLLFFLLTFEVLLRIFAYPVYGFQKGNFVYDDIVGYKLSPNYSGIQSIYGKTVRIDINSEGMRDFRNYTYDKEEDTYRILILGDSNAFGNGNDLNQTYAEYLRQDFYGENVEIINMGVPGYGINNEYLTFIEEGKKYNPDLVLLQFTGNDWGTHHLFEENGKLVVDKTNSLIANKNGLLVNSVSDKGIRSVHLFLLWNLRSYSFVYTKLRNILSNAVNKYWAKNVPAFLYNPNSAEYKQAYEGYFSLLKKLKENTNATIFILIAPDIIDNLPPEEIQKEYNLNYSINPPQTKESVAEMAQKLNISLIRFISDEQDIFLKVDGHLNPKGNKLFADKIYSELKQDGMI